MSTYTVTTKIYRHYNKPSDTPDNEAHFDDLAEATRYFDSKLPELRAKFDCFWTIELTQDSDTESKTLYIASNLDCFWTIELTQDCDNKSKTLSIATNKGAQ